MAVPGPTLRSEQHPVQLLKLVVTAKRQIGIRLILYLDDILIMDQDKKKIRQNLCQLQWNF